MELLLWNNHHTTKYYYRSFQFVTIWFNTDTFCASVSTLDNHALFKCTNLSSAFGVDCKESKHGVRPATEQLKFAAKYLVRLRFNNMMMLYSIFTIVQSNWL